MQGGTGTLDDIVMKEDQRSPDVVTDCGLGEGGAVGLPCSRVDGEWGGGAVGRSQDVPAENEEPGRIEGFSAAHHGSPPAPVIIQRIESEGRVLTSLERRRCR